MKTKITLLFFVCSLFCTNVIRSQCSGADFEEQNGIAVIEAESLNRLSSGWNRESGASGFTGNGFLAWRGSDSFNTPGNGTIQLKVRINSPGRYRFIWRNRIGIVASSNATTEHNDSWLRIPDASLFLAQRGSSIIYPRGSGRTPNPEGASSNGWFKIYTNTIAWNWNTKTSDFDAHDVYAQFNSPGIYTIQISGRSKGHFIDRIVLFDESRISLSFATSTSRGETDCDGNNNPPPPPPPSEDNKEPTVSITSPSNGQNINAGSNVSINVTANDSDGSITKYQIYVNGSIVDTDGPNYTPYVISNISNGAYSVRAVVTDNSGATSEDTVQFSVGGDNPPPPPPPSGNNVAPTVSITSPSIGQGISGGSNVSVNLSASDSDGNIVKHQIFVNGTLVDTDGTIFTPHIILNIANGNYVVKAVVTDNEGATAENTIQFSVGGDNPPPPPPPSGDNAAPIVNITSPSNGQNISSGANVSINLLASDSDGSIVKYQIFVNGTLVDTDGTTFTPHPINNIASGNYTVIAVVTDNQGATAENTIQFAVGCDNPPPPPPSGNNTVPTVSITSPSNNQTISPGSNVSVNLSASDSDGSIVKYQIFVNGTLVDTDGTTFTPHPINNIASGNYTVKAVATDNDGATAEDTVQFSVNSLSARIALEQSIVYPNPVKESNLNVQLPEEINGTVGYSVKNISGMEISNGTIEPNERTTSEGLTSIKIPTGTVPGVYYLILQTLDGQKVIPIVKE